MKLLALAVATLLVSSTTALAASGAPELRGGGGTKKTRKLDVTTAKRFRLVQYDTNGKPTHCFSVMGAPNNGPPMYRRELTTPEDYGACSPFEMDNNSYDENSGKIKLVSWGDYCLSSDPKSTSLTILNCNEQDMNLCTHDPCVKDPFFAERQNWQLEKQQGTESPDGVFVKLSVNLNGTKVFIVTRGGFMSQFFRPSDNTKFGPYDEATDAISLKMEFLDVENN